MSRRGMEPKTMPPAILYGRLRVVDIASAVSSEKNIKQKLPKVYIVNRCSLLTARSSFATHSRVSIFFVSFFKDITAFPS